MPDAPQAIATDFLNALGSLRVDRPSGEPARHQPIVLLWAISRAAARKERLVAWKRAKRELKSMVAEYGRPGSSPAPEFPFVALHRSPLWELSGVDGAAPIARGSAVRPWLDQQNPEGGLEENLYDLLASDTELCRQAVSVLHQHYFTDYRKNLLLLEAGLDTTPFDGYGPPPHIKLGDRFKKRRTLARARIHRPEIAGICGTSEKGAESVVVSGGYEDDEDYGDEIIYTGQGGRDEKTEKQYKDQTLTLGNAALVTSCSTGIPVRVIRGSGGDSLHSPDSGLRHDGLYRVEEYWPQRWRVRFSGVALSIARHRNI